MDLVEKFNNRFSTWYESLFGEHGNSELRPKDVLRKILHAMDDNRSEGIDGKVYVPNKYILALNLADDEERDYLLSFLDEDELAGVLQRYMAQNDYAVRGPLDFTITDDTSAAAPGSPKLTVRVKYEKGQIEQPAPEVVAERQATRIEIEDLPTVASLPYEDLPTVADIPKAWGSLAITEADGHRSLISLTTRVFTIGRSRTSNNDFVLATDGKISKVHARVELGSDNKPSIFDLGSTNGVTVNGRRVTESAQLSSQDTIGIGDTTMIFQQDELATKVPEVQYTSRKRALLSPSSGGTDHVLASDNLIGRSITCDIILTDQTAANRQAQIVAHEGGTYTIEDLSGKGTTLLNERVVHNGERIKLINGDRVQFGPTVFQFLENQA